VLVNVVPEKYRRERSAREALATFDNVTALAYVPDNCAFCKVPAKSVKLTCAQLKFPFAAMEMAYWPAGQPEGGQTERLRVGVAVQRTVEVVAVTAAKVGEAEVRMSWIVSKVTFPVAPLTVTLLPATAEFTIAVGVHVPAMSTNARLTVGAVADTATPCIFTTELAFAVPVTSPVRVKPAALMLVRWRRCPELCGGHITVDGQEAAVLLRCCADDHRVL